jgi:hypothetical protein
MSEFKVVHDTELDRVEVFYEGEKIGECEGYELDAICSMVHVVYEEKEQEWME